MMTPDGVLIVVFYYCCGITSKILMMQYRYSVRKGRWLRNIGRGQPGTAVLLCTAAEDDIILDVPAAIGGSRCIVVSPS